MDGDNTRSRHVSASGSYMIANTDSVLDAIDASAPASRLPPLKVANPLLCPCCKQPVTVPAPEIVIDHYGITPLEGRIFQAVWKGKGLPVITERIFTAMYIDDPDGGPTPDKMYLAFKVALCHLRQKLEGSGIGIANVGYRRGYRLVIEGKFPNA